MRRIFSRRQVKRKWLRFLIERYSAIVRRSSFGIPRIAMFFTWKVISSCQQVLELNSCNMIPLKYEFLDTCFERLDVVLWTDS